jgi:hypothetical protein
MCRAAVVAVTKCVRHALVIGVMKSSIEMSTSGMSCTGLMLIALKEISILPAAAATWSACDSTACAFPGERAGYRTAH